MSRDLSGKSKHRQLGKDNTNPTYDLEIGVSLTFYAGRMFYPRGDIDCLLLCYNPGDKTSLQRCAEYNDLSVWHQSGTFVCFSFNFYNYKYNTILHI